MSLAYNTSIDRRDLSLYIDPANPKCYSLGQLKDLSGNNNTCTIEGAIPHTGSTFIFDGSEQAESWLDSKSIAYSKKGEAWQVNLSTQSI